MDFQLSSQASFFYDHTPRIHISSLLKVYHIAEILFCIITREVRDRMRNLITTTKTFRNHIYPLSSSFDFSAISFFHLSSLIYPSKP